MSTATDTISDSELEEIFGLEIPCGGNRAHGPCPFDAAAIVKNTHLCDPHPADFKCLDCYTAWLQAGIPPDICVCTGCGLEMPKSKVYRKL